MYEVPEFVALEVTAADTQLSFVRRCLLNAAYTAGLPLLESISYALQCLSITLNENTWRINWKENKDDPTPKDSSTVKDNEFVARRGQLTNYYLSDKEKNDLRERQNSYVLRGGVLGSQIEIASQDIIIVDLNIIFDEKQFDETKAKETLKSQVDDAVNVYNQIEVKFNIVWTAGAGNSTNLEITKGKKDSFINVFLSIGDGGAISQTEITEPDPATGEVKTYNIFLTREKLSVRGLSDNSMNTWALAHELGHKFGLVGYSGVKLWGFDTTNWSSDAVINTAIIKARTGSVVKGIDWNISPFIKSMKGDLAPTTFELLRAGAKRLGRKF